MTVTNQKSVEPISTLAPYIGGKNLLHKRITACIEAVPHNIYAEPFVGMGGIFFKRRFKPKAEIVNDINSDIATLFRVLQHHYVPFLDMLRYQLTSREHFRRLCAANPDSMTDMHRAARFLYIQRVSFGGRVDRRSFGVNPTAPGRFDLTKLQPLLEEVSDRLSGVVIENLPYARFIGLYDRPETLFYLDPPYWGTEDAYGRMVFSKDDFEQLATILGGIKGSFILSINDVPQIREIFGQFHQSEVETRYSTAGGEKGRKVGELVISNRPDLPI
jgi:DNA adenine methylase